MIKKKLITKVSLGGMIKEDLPYPYTHYPNHYGSFFAFSLTEESEPCICECAIPSVLNYIELKKKIGTPSNANKLRMAPLDSFYFPNAISQLSFSHPTNPMSVLNFKNKICHRCNLAIPEMTYCHPMYGGQFMQKFGWYLRQAYFRLGIMPMSYDFLPNTCPDKFKKMIFDIRKLYIENSSMNAFPDPFINISLDGFSHPLEENELNTKTLAQTIRLFTKEIENSVREEFGIKRVGEGWISETILLNIVKRVLPEEEIIFHHRPAWLEGLEVDIFIPRYNLALEYQGQQHYHPIKLWGGGEALQKLKQRDKKKKLLCQKNFISLVEIKYTDPLTEDFVKEKILNLKQNP